MKEFHRTGAEIAEVKIILSFVERSENKKISLMSVYIFLPSQQKYIIILSAYSASLR